MGASADGSAVSYIRAQNKTVKVDGITFAYRELGPAGGVPVVFFVHLGATMDNWDPRIVDAIASGRHVITFDQCGVGGSSGEVPGTIEEAAEDAHTFIAQGLGYGTVDVFALSMGGFIAQELVVRHPELVRRLVLAGTGPRGGAGIDKVAGVTYRSILRAAIARADPKEFLFFGRDSAGRRAGREFMGRLKEREHDRDAPITLRAFLAQLKAVTRYGRSAPSDLSVITQPTLIVNGDKDRMVPSILSEDLHRRIKGSRLIIYPDSGHGSIFQYWEQFAPVAVKFLGPS
ncbi:MAG: alpha/beta hydrolase [Actinomyces sp.]|uniref:alpha/beta fold hydrolase n=1 Tax=Actinomyces sp. TaxID=29317 RepID=UPI0026DDBB53|nr:alpha/beta hydrolase [Actinomyces sp.]MDO4244321.1 alpha/beta hydrolase [Actinomyces sp.]